MKYFFVGKNLTNIEFFHSLKASHNGYVCLNFGEIGGDINLQSEDGSFTLELDFIFEYHIARYGKKSVVEHLLPEAGRLETALRKLLTREDSIYACNSGDYCSRIIHKLSEEIGFQL